MTHVTCRLTAKKRDQLRNPTLGNRVRATTFFCTPPGDRQSYEYKVYESRDSRRITKLTGVDESPGSAFAELLRFVGQRYFYDARDMSRRCVHLYGVRRQQLQHHTSPSRRRSSSYHTNARGRRDDMPPPPMAVLLAADLRPSADGSAVRTSLVAGQLQAASVPIA